MKKLLFLLALTSAVLTSCKDTKEEEKKDLFPELKIIIGNAEDASLYQYGMDLKDSMTINNGLAKLTFWKQRDTIITQKKDTFVLGTTVVGQTWDSISQGFINLYDTIKKTVDVQIHIKDSALVTETIEYTPTFALSRVKSKGEILYHSMADSAIAIIKNNPKNTVTFEFPPDAKVWGYKDIGKTIAADLNSRDDYLNGNMTLPKYMKAKFEKNKSLFLTSYGEFVKETQWSDWMH